MQPNSKKTKHLLIGTATKLYHSEITTLELSIDNVRLAESVGEKLFGVISLSFSFLGPTHLLPYKKVEF